MTRNAPGLLVALLVASCCGGCFFYDSRWGQATRSQQRVAEQRMPEELSSANSGPSAKGRAPECNFELQIRVHDAASVGASTSRHGFSEVVARANQVLAPDLAACLTVSEVRPWKQATGAAPLAEQLAELRALDGGDGVDLVVGLSPPTELLTFSFSQLGVAGVLGKHLVLRSASDAGEIDAIEAAFPDLDTGARRELYVKRKLHKATVLLLHELGHALGAIHTTQREELMYPSYSTDMQTFSEPTRALLRVSLESRQGATEPKLTPTLAARMLDLLKRAPSGTWNHDDFEARVRALEHQLAAQSGGQSPPDVGDASGKMRSDQASVSGATPSDRAVYLEAVRLLEAKRPKDAWERAKQLFDRYANSYEVQDLRCKIAMQLSVPWETTREECEPLMRLTGAATAPEPAR